MNLGAVSLPLGFNFEHMKTDEKNQTPISCAPDLLMALEDLVESIEGIVGLTDFGNLSESDFPLLKAREAIRKARGEA